MRFGREKDCEYSEKDQKSRTEILEENIAILKARIFELESAASSSSASTSDLTSGLPSWPGLTGDFDFGGLTIGSNITGHSAGSHSSSPGTYFLRL